MPRPIRQERRLAIQSAASRVVRPVAGLFVIAFLLSALCQAQPPRSLSHEWAKKSFNPSPRVIKGGELMASQWRELIDQTWGPARETAAEQCRIFDTYWVAADAGFACFPRRYRGGR